MGWDDTGKRYPTAPRPLYCNAGTGAGDRTRSAERCGSWTPTRSSVTRERAALRLADEVAARAPMDGAKVFFTSGGGTPSTRRQAGPGYFQAHRAARAHTADLPEHATTAPHGSAPALAGIPANRVAGRSCRTWCRCSRRPDRAGEDDRRHGAERVAAFFASGDRLAA